MEMDECIKQLNNSPENLKRLREIDEAFSNNGIKLAASHRVLVGEGTLTKICRKKPKERKFFLCSDVLVYGHIVQDNKKYTRQQTLPLATLAINPLPDSVNFCNAWEIVTPSKSFVVYSMTAVEKEEWMGHMERLSQSLRSKQGRVLQNSHCAAIWVPDGHTKVCMVCEVYKFTTINRKHHCRYCGKVVCDNCSKHRITLPNISLKPVRVCDFCQNNLSMSNQQIESTSSEEEEEMDEEEQQWGTDSLQDPL